MNTDGSTMHGTRQNQPFPFQFCASKVQQKTNGINGPRALNGTSLIFSASSRASSYTASSATLALNVASLLVSFHNGHFPYLLWSYGRPFCTLLPCQIFV